MTGTRTCGHDKTGGIRVHAHVSGNNAHILGLELDSEVPVLLIAQRFDWGGVDGSGVVIQSQLNRILLYVCVCMYYCMYVCMYANNKFFLKPLRKCYYFNKRFLRSY